MPQSTRMPRDAAGFTSPLALRFSPDGHPDLTSLPQRGNSGGSDSRINSGLIPSRLSGESYPMRDRFWMLWDIFWPALARGYHSRRNLGSHSPARVTRGEFQSLARQRGRAAFQPRALPRNTGVTIAPNEAICHFTFLSLFLSQ